jgi:hypothetical protein
MRQRGAFSAVASLTLASIALASCGSSGAHSSSTTTTRASESTSSTAATTTTQPLDPAAADTVAQYKLTASLNAAKSIYADNYDYTAVTPASLTPLVPNVQFTDLDKASKDTIGLLAQDKHDVLIVTKSASGRWYCITDNDTDGVSYGVGTSLGDVNSNGECQLDAWPPPGT